MLKFYKYIIQEKFEKSWAVSIGGRTKFEFSGFIDWSALCTKSWLVLPWCCVRIRR